MNVTARLVRVNRGTVSRLIKHNGREDCQLHDGLVQGIPPQVLEFDEKWSYTGHKHHTEADGEGEGGDRWDVNCLDPETKLLISVIPGPRTAETITASVADAHQRLQPGLTPPAIFTDGEAAYGKRFGRCLEHPIQPPALDTVDSLHSPSSAFPNRWSILKLSNIGVVSGWSKLTFTRFSANPNSQPGSTAWGSICPIPVPSNASISLTALVLVAKLAKPVVFPGPPTFTMPPLSFPPWVTTSITAIARYSSNLRMARF